MPKKPLFDIALSNHANGRRLAASFFPPRHRTSRHELVPDRVLSHWECEYVVRRNGKLTSHVAVGDNWLQSLLIAVSGVRRLIPDSQEEDWITEDGVPSWVIFPKDITIVWGYDFYRRMFDMVSAQEQALIRDIERRRAITSASSKNRNRKH